MAQIGTHNQQETSAFSEGSEFSGFKARHEAPTFALEDLRTIESATDGSGTKVERPSDAAIEALRHDDPRIDAIRVSEPTREGLEHAIAAQLDRDFAGESAIGIRAIQASIDGLATDGVADVHDIRDILQEGDMLGRDVVNLAGFQPAEEGADTSDRLHYHVIDFASETGQFREMALSGVEDANRVFPVLLVYDHTKMQRKGGYGYELPAGADQRAVVIRKAYVLDAFAT